MDVPGWEPTLRCLLAERFVPRRTPDVLESVIAECGMAGRVAGFQLIQAIYVPDDETCFALLEAPTTEDVAQGSEVHRLGFGRARRAVSIQLRRDAPADAPLRLVDPPMDAP
jgi:hypothetical protein